MIKQYALIGIVLVLLSMSVSAQLKCNIQPEACTESTLVLCLSDTTNAHAEAPQQNGCSDDYPQHICCSDVNGEGGITSQLSNQCSGNFAPIAYLDQLTNSHAARPSYNEDDIRQSVSFDSIRYSLPLCLSALKGVKCEISGSNNPDRDESCVLGFSGDEGTNAHLSSCQDATEEYKQFIICSIVTDQDEDRFAADKDCDDLNNKINPNMPEIGNGIDDDCDGFIDGDDTQMRGATELPDGWYQLSDAIGDDQFNDFKPGEITTQELPTGERVFVTTERGKHALVSKKILLTPPSIAMPIEKEYIASVKSSCEAEIFIAFDNEKNDPGETPGQWGFITQTILEGNQQDESEEVPELISRTLPQTATVDDKWASIIIIKENECQISQPILELKGAMSPTAYNDILTPHSEFDPLGVTTMHASSCCPEGACWNGFTCINNMRTDTFRKENVAGEAEYRCIDGNWVFSKLLYDWNRQDQGSCPDKGQCFVLSSLGETGLETPQEGVENDIIQKFYNEGIAPLCINNGTALFDHFCLDGNWTSRTKFLAQKLVEVADNQPYTVSCGSYHDLLLDEGINPGLLGGTFSSSGEQRAEGPGQPNPDEAARSVCFEQLQTKPHIGENNDLLIPNKENTCINNVCILKYTDDDGEKIVFATSLNKKLVDENGNTFLKAFNVPSDKVNEVCPPADPNHPNDFIGCNTEKFNEYFPGKLWYSPKLNAIIYGPDGVLVNPTRWEEFIAHPFETILALFQSEPAITDNENFVQNPGNLRQVYLLQQEDRQVRAVLERQRPDENGKEKETLIAEFEGFSTPVCEYLQPGRVTIPPEAQVGPLEQAAGMNRFMCTATDDLQLQRIEAVGGTDEFWPQLTNRLRTNSSNIE